MKKVKFAKSIWVLAFIIVTAAMTFISFNVGGAGIKAEAYAAGDPDELAFTIDTGEYINGICATGANLPEITLELVGELKNPGATTFWYTEQDSIGLPGPDAQWRQITDVDRQDLIAILRADEIIQMNDYYSQYIYFKTVIEKHDASGATARYEYVNPNFVDLVVDRTINQNSYEIRDITATYKNANGIDVVYDTNNPFWVSTSVTFKIVGRNEGVNNTDFWYAIDKKPDGSPEWLPASVKYDEATNSYYATATVAETFKGNVLFNSSNKNSSVEPYQYPDYGGRRTIWLDTDIPDFEVKAEKDLPGATPLEREYSSSMWSSVNVIYTITPKAIDLEADESRQGSGALYYYHTGESQNGERVWNLMSQVNNVYVLTIDKTTTTLRFKAVSNAGKEYERELNYATYIDKITPVLNLTATDGKGVNIRSLGTLPGVGYKVGYASDSIKFTVFNSASNHPDNVFFEYMIDEGGSQENYVQFIAGEAIFNEPFVNRKFKIRARSRAGLTHTIEFTVSVLKSNFSFDWEEEIEVLTNGAGWAKNEIPAYFRLPAVLDTEDEYVFWTQITGSTTPKKMDAYRVMTKTEDGVLYSVYKLYIDRSLNNQTMQFFADNKAGDRAPTLVTPYPIKLDLVTPDANVVKQIYNSQYILGENDWASGRVDIKFTPSVTNISGVRCFPLISGQRGKEIIMTDGVFTFPVSAKGTYNFVLVSGADRTQEFSIVVNIDASDIVFSGMEATVKEVVFGPNGEQITDKNLALDQSGDYYTVRDTVSGDVTVHFITNHEGHFTYYYQRYTASAPDINGYTHVSDRDTFVIPISEMESIENGTVKYAFYLESRALDATGSRKTTRVRHITVTYNIKDFSIEIEQHQSSDEWTSASINFTISVISDGAYVDISQYQLKLVSYDGTDWGWRNITDSVFTDPDEPGKKTYSFDGISQIYPETGANMGLAFHGRLYFRAVNTAGRVSDVRGDEIFIKLDKTQPNPEYAIIKAAGGEIVSDGMGGYIVYSNTPIFIRETNNDPGKPIFGNLAPISYYFCEDTGFTNTPPEASYTRLNGERNVSGRAYYLFARNELNQTSNYVRYTFIVEDSAKRPTATLSAVNAAIGVAGIYEFNWSTVATINITAISDTKVYYWYKIGQNGEWVKYNTIAKTAGVLEEIRFVGEPDSAYENAIVGNMDATVEFRVTNISGSTATFAGDARVRIRIDVRTPYFDIETTSRGDVIDRSAWQSSEIFIRLFPVERRTDGGGNEILVPIDPVTANPGGVIYTYRLDPSQPFENLPGDGTFFSTDDLATSINGSDGFDGNGEISIQIRATAKESRKFAESTIVLRVDKVMPEFDLMGEITIPGTANTTNIASGTWTQAEEVRISKVIKAVSKSPVSYTYYTDTDPHNISPWDHNNPLIRTEISNVVVVATNGSGLRVEKVFEVKIDNQPPLIVSGIIRNAMKTVDGKEVIDREHPNTYYIDQAITYVEENFKYAKYNNFLLTNGQIIATNTVDNSNTGGIPGGKGGYVHIIVEDMAGNKSELIFYMTIFELTINTITLSQEHKDLLAKYEEQFEEGKSGLTSSRRAYFQNEINRLRDRLATLQKEVNEYQNYLLEINSKNLFTLVDDYAKMHTYINYFTTNDPTILYPEWQQNMIKQGEFAQYFVKLETEYNKLKALMETVTKLQQSVAALPAINVVTRDSYTDIIRVFNAYESMLGTQKEVFDTSLYTKLIELKRRCEVLLLSDAETGIKIDGSDLTPGVALEVLKYEKASGFVNNIQQTLFETITEGSPRAVIYVSKLSLTDFGSQYNTGEITVTLPIPNEFQNYIEFAVYRLSADGTIIPINGSVIDSYGRNVSFSTNSLDTYILTANAVPEVKPAEEKIYGSIFDIEIDATLLTYITFAAVGMFVVLLAVVIFITIRQRGFLKKYNKAYKRSLWKKGVNNVPKGNPPARTNPATITEKMDYSKKAFYK